MSKSHNKTNQLKGPRSVREEEFESAVNLADAVFRCDGTRRSIREDYPLLFSKTNPENLRAFIDNGRVVALTGVLLRDIVVFNHRIPSIRIGMVCTDPKYRGRGLATALLADVERFAVRKGALVALISGDRKLYERFGAVNAGVSVKYKLGAEMLIGFSASTMRSATSTDLPLLAQTYAEKGVRFERRLGDFEQLFAASIALDRPAQIFVHEDSSSSARAYIVTIRDEEGTLNCVEHAGDLLCVVGMIRSLSEGEGEPVVVHTIGADRALNRLLSQVSLPEVNELPRTCKIISPEGLFTSLDRYFAEQLARSKVAAIQEMVGKIDGPELTRAIFGTTKLPIATLSVRVEGCPLPIPLPDYGMGYL